MAESDSADWVARAVAGEAGAFETLVSEYHALVYRWAMVAADDPDEADDVAQLVWIKVYRNLKSYQGNAKFSTWLYRITFNTAVEGRRTRERRATGIRTMTAATDPSTHVVEVPDEIDAGRFVGVVRSYLSGLPLRQRTVFALADLEGISAAEIAERLEIPEVTVRTNLFKARRAIRERLLREEPQLMREYRS